MTDHVVPTATERETETAGFTFERSWTRAGAESNLTAEGSPLGVFCGKGRIHEQGERPRAALPESYLLYFGREKDA
jgi:hypothetical protein